MMKAFTSAPSSSRTSWFFFVSALLCILFLVIFPKGGFKVSDIPVTWGYLLLPLLAPIGFLSAIRKLDWSGLHIKAWAMTLPFALFSNLVIHQNGYVSSGYAVSFFITTVFIPFVMLICFSPFWKNINPTLIKILTYGLIFVALFGIFNFFYRYMTGNFLEVPYLTVNIDDLGLIDRKRNDREGIMKLVSTYNNGNLYGASILILLPLFCYFRGFFSQAILKSSLILTLSRSVWFGLLVYEIINIFFGKKKTSHVQSIFYLIFFLSAAVIAIFYSLSLMNRDINFIFDENLGGRFVLLEFLNDWEWISTTPFLFVQEIVYLSIFYFFGLFGLLLFGLWLFGPILLSIIEIRKAQQIGKDIPPYTKSLLVGLISYCIIACSDGAFQLIPVMAIYWAVAAWLLALLSASPDPLNPRIQQSKRPR